MTEGVVEQDWREVPRAEMFKRVIAAVDAGRLEAMEHGGVDDFYVRYIDSQVFPFLEHEMEGAYREEA
jgi:hypothetical protein